MKTVPILSFVIGVAGASRSCKFYSSMQQARGDVKSGCPRRVPRAWRAGRGGADYSAGAGSGESSFFSASSFSGLSLAR